MHFIVSVVSECYNITFKLIGITMTDWGFATQVAGTGFLTVFIVLSVLLLVIWAVNLLISRINRSKTEK